MNDSMRCTDNFLPKSLATIGGFVKDAVDRELESVRIAMAAYSLLFAGVSARTPILKAAAELLVQRQKPDGGWSDTEETAWAIGCISLVGGQEDPAVQSAIHWLNNVRLHSAGWGRHPRDQARIPTTALILTLMPSIIKSEDMKWLKNEWTRDFHGPVRLSYKAGFFLLATPQGQEDELVKQTIDHLAQNQNDDGGFAPWKGHPIGSDPWSTGVVLWGLSQWVDQVDHVVLEKVLNWLQETQLPSGYWPYHYLDDGTSLALIGSVAALKSLKARE